MLILIIGVVPAPEWRPPSRAGITITISIMHIFFTITIVLPE